MARHLLGASFPVLFLAEAAAAQLSPPVPRAPPANCTSAEQRQFDFWIGRWDVYRTGTEELSGRSEVEAIYNGCAIRETWRPFDMNEGGSVSSYDRAAGLWQQNWVDSTGERLDYQGRVEGQRMVLTTTRQTRAGQAQMTRVTQYPEGANVRLIGEISIDRGRTWTPSYDYTYRPAGSPPR